MILEINGENTADMLNVEAQNKIKNSKTHLQLVVERYADKPSAIEANMLQMLINTCYHDI